MLHQLDIYGKDKGASGFLGKMCSTGGLAAQKNDGKIVIYKLNDRIKIKMTKLKWEKESYGET